MLLIACMGYHLLFPHQWLLFACLFLFPDLSLFLFMRGPSTAASVVYNILHSYVLPACLGALAMLLSNALFGEISLIWSCHISFDRMLGYGLKYPFSFKFTHIQGTASHDALVAEASSPNI